MSSLATLGNLAHPEWVAGRRLWIDPSMKDIIDKIQHGDPTKGWEGDPNLCVYSQKTGDGMMWELCRLEDDGEYRVVARSKPGVVFDERIIHLLVENDMRRNPHRDLAAEVETHNARVDADKQAANDEYMNEEVGPRLRHAFRRDNL